MGDRRHFSGPDLVNRRLEVVSIWVISDPFGTMPESNLIIVEQSDLAVMYPELSPANLSVMSQEREELSRQLGQRAPETV